MKVRVESRDDGIFVNGKRDTWNLAEPFLATTMIEIPEGGVLVEIPDDAVPDELKMKFMNMMPELMGEVPVELRKSDMTTEEAQELLRFCVSHSRRLNLQLSEDSTKSVVSLNLRPNGRVQVNPITGPRWDGWGGGDREIEVDRIGDLLTPERKWKMKVVKVTPQLVKYAGQEDGTASVKILVHSLTQGSPDPLTVGQLREMMEGLGDEVVVCIDYDALCLTNNTRNPAVAAWGAYSGPEALVIVR